MPVTPQERQITSCRARAGQHARPSHKHCKACDKYAYVQPPRARTNWYMVSIESPIQTRTTTRKFEKILESLLFFDFIIHTRVHTHFTTVKHVTHLSLQHLDFSPRHFHWFKQQPDNASCPLLLPSLQCSLFIAAPR